MKGNRWMTLSEHFAWRLKSHWSEEKKIGQLLIYLPSDVLKLLTDEWNKNHLNLDDISWL